MDHSQYTVYGLENRRICCHIINDDLWIPFYMLFFMGDVGGGGEDEDDRNGKHVTFWLLLASLLLSWPS
jgi:hypothetical protein